MQSIPKTLRLLKYVWPHRRDLFVVLFTMFLSIGLSVLGPWPTKVLVDHVLGQRAMPDRLNHFLATLPWSQGLEGLLLWVCIGTLLIFVASSLLAIISNTASIRFAQRVTYDLGADLFLHLQRLSLLFHSRRSVGDLISIVTGDSYCVQTMVNSALIPILQSVITLAVMFGIMWQLEPTMTVLSLSIAPFLALSIHLFRRPMKDRGRERRNLEVRMTSHVQQVLNAVPAVQAFTREELEYDLFRESAAQTVKAYVRTGFAQMYFKLFVGLVTALGTAAMMYLGGIYALQGKVTVGTILVFISYLAALYGPLNSLTYVASTWQTLGVNADRVVEILDTPRDVDDLPDAEPAHLRGGVTYEKVVFGYDRDRPVLNGISFEAKQGEVVAIVGPTGAGKTTLVNLLMRFYDPCAGAIKVDGQDLRKFQVKTLREQIAIVLQEPFIFPISVADNIAYGKGNTTREEIVAAAQAANAHEFIQRLPEGYDTIIGERGATLSGGEKQRLSIARAFLKKAPILILDEPTSALDANTETLLLNALESLMKDRTTFVIAHRLSTIRNADRILVIDNGQVVEEGKHEELIAQGRLYGSLYYQQMDSARHREEADPLSRDIEHVSTLDHQYSV